MTPASAPIPHTSTLEEVSAWFFEDYLNRWATAGSSGEGPEFITSYWASPLWAGGPEQGEAGVNLAGSAEVVVGWLNALHTRLRAAGYSHTVVPDRRITVFHARGAAIEVIWSRRRADDSEIERLAVHFLVAKGVEGWRAIAIQTQTTDSESLDEVWPIHRPVSTPERSTDEESFDFSSRSTLSGVDYLTSGSGEKGWIVFAHGYRDGAIGWQWVARELVKEGWCVAAVQRTAVDSPLVDSESALDAYAAQVLEVITDLGEQPGGVVVVGQSMGGAVAELAASRSTTRVRALILAVTAPLGGMSLPQELLDNFRAGTTISDPAQAGEAKLGLAVNQGADVAMRLVIASPEETQRSAMQTLMAWVDGHPDGRTASKVLAPTLVVATDDQFFSEALLRDEVAPRFVNARVEVLHGAGHFPHIERPMELAATITRFLSGI